LDDFSNPTGRSTGEAPAMRRLEIRSPERVLCLTHRRARGKLTLSRGESQAFKTDQRSFIGDRTGVSGPGHCPEHVLGIDVAVNRPWSGAVPRNCDFSDGRKLCSQRRFQTLLDEIFAVNLGIESIVSRSRRFSFPAARPVDRRQGQASNHQNHQNQAPPALFLGHAPYLISTLRRTGERGAREAVQQV